MGCYSLRPSRLPLPLKSRWTSNNARHRLDAVQRCGRIHLREGIHQLERGGLEVELDSDCDWIPRVSNSLKCAPPSCAYPLPLFQLRLLARFPPEPLPHRLRRIRCSPLRNDDRHPFAVLLDLDTTLRGGVLLGDEAWCKPRHGFQGARIG